MRQHRLDECFGVAFGAMRLEQITRYWFSFLRKISMIFEVSLNTFVRIIVQSPSHFGVYLLKFLSSCYLFEMLSYRKFVEYFNMVVFHLDYSVLFSKLTSKS